MFRKLATAAFAGIFASLVIMAAGALAPAHAEQFERTQHSITVRIDRAGVARGHAEAVAEAHDTILRAARRVCGLAGGPRLTLRERRDGQACLRDTVGQAVASVRSPYLANAFAGLLGPERLARLEWGTPQFTAFALALPEDGAAAA